MRILVDFKVAYADDRIVLDLFARAAQDCADARDDFLKAERFRHVVVATDRQPHDLVLRVVAGGQEEDGRVDALLADAACDGESVDVRQHDVEDDQIRSRALDDFDRLRARRRRLDFVTCEMQRGDKQFADGGFVVDDDDFRFNTFARIHTDHHGLGH